MNLCNLSNDKDVNVLKTDTCKVRFNIDAQKRSEVHMHII